ncbi:MAG: hypothetical protein IJA75_05075 [Oscillospiraceae bacterium]|nr:hypothetical protein [Oscillospiraceae bacterium]
MEMNQQMLEYMEKLEQSNRQQVRFARVQCIFSILAAVCCLLLLLTVAKLVPDIRELSGQISDIAAQAETVLTNLETVTEELAAADLTSVVEDVDALVVTSQEALLEALTKVNSIDIETLNIALEHLAKIVERLERVSSFLGR